MILHRFAATLAIAALLAGCELPPPGPGGPLSRSSRGRAPLDGDLAQESASLREKADAHFREQKQRVERVSQRLLQTIPGHPKVQFVIARGDPSINAGASFGQVAITSGMLNFIKSDDEMAMVLGHELSHITQGHVMKGAVSGLALSVLATVLEARVPGAGRAAGGIGQLFLAHYTQTQEREADEVGLRYAYEAGYDPRAAVDLQERMAVEVPQSMSAGYFDTHPSSVERAVAAREEARELLARGDPPGREEVLAMERADERPDPIGQRRREERSLVTHREPAPSAAGDSDVTPARASDDSAACRRAAVYADMARDSRDPAERDELQRRALRYCPTVSEAHRAPASHEPRDEDRAEPVDTY